MTDFILDNSVAMRWCFDKGSHPYADSVLRRLGTGGERAYVPILWRYEVSAVLARAQNTGALTAAQVVSFIGSLEALPITVDAQSSEAVFTGVHQLAIVHRITSYDAAYLELALRLDLPLATLDAELIASCSAAGAGIL